MEKEEAIKILRGVHDNALFSVRNALETLIPELKESEDERILKNLQTCLHCGKTHGMVNDDEYLVCKNYLEKQKEQKSEQSEMEKEYVRTLHSLISDFLQGKQEIDREYYQQIWDWLDNRHIEQKPVEWSKEDESNLQSCIAKIEIDMQHWGNHGKTMVDGDIKLIDWLKSLRPQAHWKPSKEQMSSLRLAIKSAKKAQMNATADILNEIYEQLKKL